MSRLPLRVLAAMFAVLSVAGCSPDGTTAPASRLGPSNRADIGFAHRHFSNSQKYKDAGAKPAHGRAGTATMEVLALLAKDGTTEVDASTGSLELGTTDGIFRALFLKLSSRGRVKRFVSYNDLSSGTWTKTFPSLRHGDSVWLQGYITGVDAHRIDVVRTAAAVKLRPDIAVQSVQGPAQSRPQQLVNFSATLSETNGDLGARANCVLSVNGAPVDSATGIWVDAGGVVSCAFAHTFSTAGTYAVQVAATNVSPSDWDSSNNSASTSITIVDPGQPIASGTISVQKMDRQWTRAYTQSGGSLGPDTRSETGQESSLDVFVNALDLTSNALPQHVDAVITVDGTIQHSATFDTPSLISNNSGATYSQVCWEYDSDGEFLSACSYSDASGTMNTNYYYELRAGTVTYSGNEHYCDALNVCNSYEYNVANTTGTGATFDVGSALEIHLSYVDVNGLAHTVDQIVHPVLQPADQWPNSVVHACGYDDFDGNYCEDDVSKGTFYVAELSWP